MRIDPKSYLLNPCQVSLSPNCDDRTNPQDISLLVIHGISLPPGQFGSEDVRAFFMNELQPHKHPYFEEIAQLRVSTHVFIRRDGQIWQFVPFHKRAWHAGVSSFKGREKCNDFSIGIELEGADDLPYTPDQYSQLAQVTQIIRQQFPAITLDNIVGHSDIAPNRKTDPGAAFDWDQYRRSISNVS